MTLSWTQRRKYHRVKMEITAWIRVEMLEVASTIRDGRSVHLAEAVLHYVAPGVPNPNPFTKYDNVVRRPRQCTQ